jgi:thiamine-monophosphate kinase
MDLRELGEREAIDRIHLILGKTPDRGRGGDDSAAIPMDDGTFLLASTDMVLGETHILPGASPEAIGRFAVEIAISDIAAMGGRPLGVLSGYAMPPDTDIQWLQGVTAGMVQAVESIGTFVLGGDTKRSPERTIAVTALGQVAEEQCMFRHGAKEGDVLLLTGPVGGPALGYNMERNPDGSLTGRARGMVYDVRARLMAGQALATSGYAHACIDLSDGLAPCLYQMMDASDKGAELHWSDVPLADGLVDFTSDRRLDLKEMALNWGGEYELLAAIDPEGADPLMQAMGRLGLEAAIVGKVLDAPRQNIIISERGRELLRPHGFDHFQG